MRCKIVCTIFCLLMSGTAVISCKKPDNILKMATTTSTDNTGLLDNLKPRILKDTGIDLHWVAVGSGKALELGKNCDIDILLVHSPMAENTFIYNKYGIIRKHIMYNDFVIIGPAHDPAQIKGKSIEKVLNIISQKKSPFTSRGDNSGTHKKEISLWRKAGIILPDKENWYIQTGQGMLSTINIAAEHKAYTLADRGTFIKYASTKKGAPPLVILAEGDKDLLNQYSVIAINPERCPKTKIIFTKKLIAWFISQPAQQLIGEFRVNNKKLFVPNAQSK